MEDRYLFRAKRKKWELFPEAQQWVQGYYVHTAESDYIVSPYEHTTLLGEGETVEIEVNTLCQCTGLKDKNGKLIWENDIVKDLFSDACAQIKYGSYQSCFDSTKTEHVGFYVDWSGKYTKRYRKDLGYWIHMVDAEAIGNIFDNPELLKSEG